ncbi:MAG: hypothetical protein AB4040_02400 [Synechococcus sp.]
MVRPFYGFCFLGGCLHAIVDRACANVPVKHMSQKLRYASVGRVEDED